MLSGKIPLNYERAIFITENAYRNNSVSYDLFKSIIDFQANNIKNIVEANRNEKTQDFKQKYLEVVTEEEKKERYRKALYNWAIYTYLTDTTYVLDSNKIYYHLPFGYSYNDPMGTINWENSQVFSLLSYDKRKANCFALASLYKILAERLNTDASLGLAPGHIYITHEDNKGITYNIEVASHSFPGNGTIMTLTYTPLEAVQKGIALRTLDLKQSVALCLVYLAKGYEHKFNTKTDNFIYQCAATTLKYDSLNLNAMLLKAEVLEESILNKKKTVAQLQTDKQFKEYQNLIVSLFEKGYREMPLDMKNLIINRLQKDSVGLVLTDHTPKGFQTINPKDDRYATLSWGMFDEIHEPKLIEQYGRTLLNTKTKKLTKFITADTLYNKYPIDPVIAAWNIDPLAAKFPNMSPYSAFNNNPIYYVDPSGESGVAYKTQQINEKTGRPIMKVVSNMYIYGAGATEANRAAIQNQSNAQWNNGGNNFTYTDDAGTTYDVVFEFKTQIIDEKDVDTKMVEGGYGNLNAENNFYEIRADAESATINGTNNNGGNAGVLKESGIGELSPAHEENHGFGGTNKDTDKPKDPLVSKPDIAEQGKNCVNQKDRKVTQENVTEIMKKVKFDASGKGNVGSPKPYKYDKNDTKGYKKVDNPIKK